ncbi:MAG: hypothetical protein DSY80_01670 [Desulfocapsa sp.]|nr:MAG: hypothetical protein DSY80_01670 [Desulfocapsa sp.]
MSDYIEIMVLVEGKTEEIFVNDLLRPYMAQKKIYLYPTQLSKPGQKGGDVRFSRAQRDIGMHLKQRLNTYVTTLIDFYGAKEWPGLDSVRSGATPAKIAQTINEATKTEVVNLFADWRANVRFIPYVAVHEFEAMLFSDVDLLSVKLNINKEQVEQVLAEYGEPEAINNNPETAPSKRLDGWSVNGKFPKTTTGIVIARQIGIPTIREKCPLFDDWLTTIENIQRD